MVNGVRIEMPKRLRSGYRVILGDFHIFRFNHPQEARQERAEQGSLLKQSVTADQLESPSPAVRQGHDRSGSTMSRALSDVDDLSGSGAESPAPWKSSGRDTDWNFARREAVGAVLGPDQKISSLTDDELDVLFDDLQRVRAVRKARPESRIFDSVGGGDDDTDSVSSHPVREKYLSNGTLDNFSLDTALTIPSTPQMSEEDDKLKQVREEMQTQLDKQKEDYQSKLQAAEGGSMEINEMRAEKTRMEEDLRQAKEEMQKQLALQKAKFDKQLAEYKTPPIPKRPSKRPSTSHGKGGLSERDVYLAKHVLEHWRRQRWISIAAAVLSNASILKEAQIMSQQLDAGVVFQYTIVDLGHTFGSSYDLVLNGISAEENNDPDLEEAIKPCLGVRVIDFRHSVIRLWSIQKLHSRVRGMRQMHQFLDRPEYMQHFRLDNPFEEAGCMPEYTRVGDADIPLAAVFECRVQDFTLDVYSTYTNSVVGIVHLSLEPSSAEAPKETLKFNVVMHEMIGFAEREGTNVHAQLFIPGISGEGGATTTSLISGFEEGPVRFESVHSMSLPLSAPREASLRVSVFARVTTMHLDKLLSWDDMRDSAAVGAGGRPKLLRNNSRIPEHEFYVEERHDVFARVQVLEIGEEGTYQPVEVVQASTLDNGSYQLHQGIQRRIALSLTHSSGEALPWTEVFGFRAGQVHLLDSTGKVSDSDAAQPDVALTLVSPPVIRNDSDGTTHVKMVGQWDSSVHNSLLLDRPTREVHRVRLTLKFEVSSPRVIQPMTFTFDIAVQMRPRTWFAQNSLLSQLWHNQRVVHSSSKNFSICLKPCAAKRAGDLWRMDTTGKYISGEEMLQGWGPRGVSLIHDFLDLKKRQHRTAEIEAARGSVSDSTLLPPLDPSTTTSEPNESQRALLQKFLHIWHSGYDTAKSLQTRANTSPDTSITNTTHEPASQPPLAASVELTPKSPALLKAGWLLVPDATQTKWQRRYVELRRPYLHIYSSAGDEEMGINLTNSRIDSEPQIARLLQREGKQMEVWAVYAVDKAWVFACRNGRERGEWIWGVDRAMVGGELGGGGDLTVVDY